MLAPGALSYESIRLSMTTRKAKQKPWAELPISDSPGLIGIHGTDGHIYYMNPAACRSLGYEPGELDGRSFLEILAPSVLPYFAPAMDRVKSEGGGEGLMLIRHRDGSTRRWWYRHRLLENGDDTPLVLGDSTDITEIQSLDETLRESEERFRYLAENIAQVFWVRDPRTSQILYVSPAFETVWQRERNWIIDQPWIYVETVHPDDRPILFENFAKSAMGEATQMEYRILRPDSSERWIWSHSFPVRSANGEIARVVAITEDITDRKRAEEDLRHARDVAQAATEDKSTLLAHVSHEVRSPLNAIFGLCEMLLDSDLNESQRHDLERISQLTHSLNALANDLLDYSKVGSRTVELKSIPFHVQAVLEDALAPFTAKPKPDVVFSGAIDPGVPPVVVGDPNRFRQVLTNLIGNAAKFTERGAVHTRIDVARGPAGAVVLRCTVEDTGPGIAIEDQHRIFKPFSQVHDSAKAEKSGVGLGLAICAELVRLLDGDIWVDSVVGCGSTFGFTARFGLPDEP